jgi:hypothetical protein
MVQYPENVLVSLRESMNVCALGSIVFAGDRSDVHMSSRWRKMSRQIPVRALLIDFE